MKATPSDSSTSTETSGSLELTGSLGNVMKESAQLAYTYAKAFTAQQYPDNSFMQTAHIHLHVPEVKVYGYSI